MIALSVILMSRADLRAALGDVAIADPLLPSQFLDPIFRVERMHFERGGVNEKARPDELVVHVMVAQHMADVLAKKALDAFAEFLHAIDVLLCHPPRAVGGIWRPRLELS